MLKKLIVSLVIASFWLTSGLAMRGTKTPEEIAQELADRESRYLYSIPEVVNAQKTFLWDQLILTTSDGGEVQIVRSNMHRGQYEGSYFQRVPIGKSSCAEPLSPELALQLWNKYNPKQHQRDSDVEMLDAQMAQVLISAHNTEKR